MPRPIHTEKSKDFKSSIIRLLKNLNPWKYLMISALLLALISAIFALITPNKLSEFADTIGDGLVPNTQKLTEIISISSQNIDIEKINKLDLTKEEKQITTEILSKIDINNKETYTLMIKLSYIV